MLFSIHGLVRGHDLELGRDADTGGQVTYVVELARALAQQPAVDKVDLVTRLIEDPRVDSDYAVPVEELAPGARIVRVPCGPRRYLAKEKLWPHLDAFMDNLVRFLRS
ncbi:MAG: HAD family hydrolase, partial [Acidobacteriota bacterium]